MSEAAGDRLSFVRPLRVSSSRSKTITRTAAFGQKESFVLPRRLNSVGFNELPLPVSP